MKFNVFFSKLICHHHSRKEALNGFSDAQAAVSAPREVMQESATPGAPPTYDDVLREDQQRTSGKSSVFFFHISKGTLCIFF